MTTHYSFRLSLIPAIAVLLLFTLGCPHKVQVTVTNPTDKTLSVTGIVKNEHGLDVARNNMGTISPQQSQSTTLEVDSGGQVAVEANIPGSVQVFTFSKTITKADPEHIDLSVALSLSTCCRIPDNPAEVLGAIFDDMGTPTGFAGDTGNIASTLFGGLIVYIPPSQDSPKGNPLFHLTPAQFGNSVTPKDQVVYPDRDRSRSAVMTRSTASGIKSQIPLIGGLGFQFSQDTLYKMNWNMKGAGPFGKPEPADWSYLKGIQSLGAESKNGLCKAIQSKPEAVILYVNKLYLLKHAEFSVEEGNKLNTGVTADGNTFVSGNVGYNFANQNLKSESVHDQVINVGGIELKPRDIDGCGEANKNALTVSPVAREAIVPGPIVQALLSLH